MLATDSRQSTPHGEWPPGTEGGTNAVPATIASRASDSLPTSGSSAAPAVARSAVASVTAAPTAVDAGAAAAPLLDHDQLMARLQRAKAADREPSAAARAVDDLSGLSASRSQASRDSAFIDDRSLPSGDDIDGPLPG